MPPLDASSKQGGQDGQRFQRYSRHIGDIDPFSVALGDLRAIMSQQILALALQYDIDVDEDLASILPWPRDDDDPSFVPGFD